MAGGEIRHRGTKTIEMIRDARMIHMLPASFSVPPCLRGGKRLCETKPINKVSSVKSQVSRGVLMRNKAKVGKDGGFGKRQGRYGGSPAAGRGVRNKAN
jgi:hypothetical protein